ncbi:MAG: hypothetical protein EAZ97_12580 [Bacteroidetes bacterium]|nr:MAG: hypothetical protein EAZ97_12580 [Bacteroidota bacterium]
MIDIFYNFFKKKFVLFYKEIFSKIQKKIKIYQKRIKICKKTSLSLFFANFSYFCKNLAVIW